MSTDDKYTTEARAWITGQIPGYVPCEDVVDSLADVMLGMVAPHSNTADDLARQVANLQIDYDQHIIRFQRLGQRAKEALGVETLGATSERGAAGFEGAFDLLIARLCGMQERIAMVLKNHGHGIGCPSRYGGVGVPCSCWREELGRMTP